MGGSASAANPLSVGAAAALRAESARILPQRVELLHPENRDSAPGAAVGETVGRAAARSQARGLGEARSVSPEVTAVARTEILGEFA